jgi:diguanylate cyclase (GGDEF)-like protein
MREIRATLYRNLMIGVIVTVLVIVINLLLVNYYQSKLEDLATTDDLTGLPNRRFFMAQAAREVANASRAGQPISMLMIDLDYFKSVNDTCGHDVGDCVLRHVSELLFKALRKGDLAGRIGGEEFAVVLPQADAESAKEVAERLRELVERASLPPGKDMCKVTASVGVATDMEGLLDLESLLKQADKALYVAKERGRNMVFATEGGGPVS